MSIYGEIGHPGPDGHVMYGLVRITGYREQRQFVLDWWEKEGKRKYAEK